MSKEAMKLALEALEEIHPGNMTPIAEEAWKKAITALRETLAEQPAPMIRGDIRDGLVDDEPAHQEPVAIALNTGTKQGVKWLKNVEHGEHLYTSPQAQPAQRTWVGLTDEDIGRCFDAGDGTIGGLIAAIEAKLRERNA